MMLRMPCVLFIIGLSLAACGSAASNGESNAVENSQTVSSSSEQAVAESPARYEDRDGDVYYYTSVVSDEDKAKGRAVGSVVGIRYLGKRDGKHVLENVGPDGESYGRAECSEPCRIITSRLGGVTEQVPFNSESVIGAAFEDAINGRLTVVREAATQKPAAEIITNASGSSTSGDERGKRGRCKLSVSGRAS